MKNMLPRWLRQSDFQNLPVSERILMLAAARVGETEVRRNSSPFIDTVLSWVGLNPGYAWCAAFVYWTCRTAGVPANLLPSRRQAAAVVNWRNWARREGLITTKPRRGDLMFWVNPNGTTGHIGILTKFENGVAHTIEGNTDEEGSREGDGVFRKERTDTARIEFIAFRRWLEEKNVP